MFPCRQRGRPLVHRPTRSGAKGARQTRPAVPTLLSFINEEHMSMKHTFGQAPGINQRSLDPMTATSHPFLMWIFQIIAALGLLLGLAASTTASAHDDTKADIPENLMPPAGAVQLFELDARGVQIYTCEEDPEDATAFVWTFVAPEAELLNKHGDVVGTHFAGPTWQGNDGSAVIAEVLERADAPDGGAIPWLLLGATDHAGSGAFS